MLQKVEALLAELKAPWSYADAIAKRQYKVERCAWLKTVEQYTGLIAALDVELEKRRLLSTLEEFARVRCLTMRDIESSHPKLPKNWRRNQKWLKALCANYKVQDVVLAQLRED